MRRKSGFTLIELLVVVAIILVLAAILFPVFAAAKRTAMRSACSNNVKQLTLAIITYATDNGGKVVPSCDWGGGAKYTNPITGGKISIYPSRLTGYMKAAGVTRCPLVNDTLLRSDYFRQPPSNTSTCTYGINWRFECGGAQAAANPVTDKLPKAGGKLGVTQTLDAPSQPAKTVLVVETQDYANWMGGSDPATPSDYYGKLFNGSGGGNLNPYGDWKDTNGNWMAAVRMFEYPAVPYGHNGTNVGLADGHVQFIRAPRLRQGDATHISDPTPRYSTMGRAGLTWWDFTDPL